MSLQTLVNPTAVGTDVAGPMANFDPNQAYSWPAFTWTGSYIGPSTVARRRRGDGVRHQRVLEPGGGHVRVELRRVGARVDLTYSPSAVPEPGTLALVGLAAGLAGLRLRRKTK